MCEARRANVGIGATRWFIAPALAILAVGLFLVPRASDFVLMLAVIGAVAASAGILSPILTYWISSKAGRAQGAELGKQTAASSLGAGLGSAAGGLLFNVAPLPGASFLLVTVLTVLCALLSLGLPKMLVTRKIGKDTDDMDADVSGRYVRKRITEAIVSRVGTTPAQP
jgi:predicted MFS family arabinose efflux permease